jgi:protein ImuB
MPARASPWFAAIVPVRLPGGARAVRRIAERCLRWTPRVHVEPDDGHLPLVLLDLRGCLRVNGGARRVAGRIGRALAGRGIEHACSMDACAGAAAVRATAVAVALGEGDEPGAAHRLPLDLLPVRALRIDAGTVDALLEVNVRTVGELRLVARDALADRFGPSVGMRIDLATGARPWAFVPIPHPDDPRAGFGFDSPCACPVAAGLAMREAVGSLCAVLASRCRGVRALAVHVARAGLPAVRGTVHLGAPTRDPAHLWSVLRPRLERIHLGRHELGQGIERIELRAVRTGRVPDGAAAPDDGTRRSLGELADHLAARLGDGAVRRPA